MHLKLLIPLLLSFPLCAAMTVSLSPSLASPQPVGTEIVWTPTATDTAPGSFDYQFAVSANGGPMQIFQEYHTSQTFGWAPYLREESFVIQVTARNSTTLETTTTSVPYIISPRTSASGGSPVITRTANPLVALYSLPGCPTGSTFRVKFTHGQTTQRTTDLMCSPTATGNLYIAGMRESRTYQMNYEIVTNGSFTSGPVLPFRTGVIPKNLLFPKVHLIKNASTDLQQSVMLINAEPPTVAAAYFLFATDLDGNIIWYHPRIAGQKGYNMRPALGGTVLLVIADPTTPNQGQQIFREIDLAGNTIRQTCTKRLSEQLIALGKLPIAELNHDVLRLPNGHTLLISSQEKLYPAGTQGSTGPVDILGNAIIELDENLQIFWTWSAYDHLDVNRRAVLNETCTFGNTLGCPPLSLAKVANDWTHGNSLSVGSDGSLLFSTRNQDFIYKIDWANGTGTGNVIWKLGLGGDFTMTTTTDEYPWFSHQHNAEWQGQSTTKLTVFDNGNTRRALSPGDNSRGQALTIDETAMTATLDVNVDTGVFSVGIGSSQLLDNGNFHFAAGWITAPSKAISAQSYEVLPTGEIIYQLNDDTLTYRTYRMASLYSVQ